MSTTSSFESQHEKICLRVCEQQGADQPVHLQSLVSAFVILLLESIISRLRTSAISIFYLVSVAEQAGLNLTLPETLKTCFVVSQPIL